MKRIATAFALLAAALFMVQDAQAAKYKLDAVHSDVSFKIRHFVSNTSGRFKKFNVDLDFNAKKPKQTKVKATIYINSVDTNNTKRDSHLKEKAFFHTAKYPTMTFVSTKVTGVKRKGKQVHMNVHGKLTMKGKTNPIVLKVVFNGEKNFGPRFGTRAGFSISTKINRYKYGVSYGRGIVGGVATVSINIEAIKKG